MSYVSSESQGSIPDVPPDSPGSSVSARLMDEYEELLKYAVVVPKYDPEKMPKTITDIRDSFPQPKTKETLITVRKEKTEGEESEGEGETTPVVVRVTRETGLPDFGQSPIRCKLNMSQESTASDPPKQHGLTSNPPKQHGLANMLISQSDYRSSKTNPKTDFQTEKLSSSQKDIDIEEIETVYSTTVDHDISKMDNLLDQWCLDLKRNVLAEFSQAKIRIVETSKQKLMKEQERHASEKTQLCNEIDSLKELLHTYELSIERKDQVISNLTHAMQKQKEKMEMMHKFSEWKLKHIDKKRESFASKLAYRHYEKSLCKKVWDSWHSVIEDKWRSRVERACQAKAQEVCMQLTNDYESRIASLNEALEAARTEVSKLHTQRELYEEAMKKAFMRGVCALNLEAMTMFQPPDENTQPAQNGKDNGYQDYTDNLDGSLPEKEFGTSKTIPQEPIYTSHPVRDGAQPKVITSQGSRSTTLSSMAQSKAAFASKTSTSSSHKGKVINAKISSKIDTGRPGSGLSGGSSGGTLAPPMSSVMVERHQPVSKQTIGHATAGKYPRQTNTLGDQQSGIMHRKIAGQSGPVTLSPHVQTVKVVD